MRRFDKKQNILEANQRLEKSYLNSKNFEESDIIFKQIYLESFEELNIEFNALLVENKEKINEAIGLMITGAVLASGKLIDLIGVIFKKFRNFLISKGWLKGEKWDKTKAEIIGEKIQKYIIEPIFQALAGLLLAPMGTLVAAFGGDPEKVMGEENRKKLGNTLFYGAVIGVGATSILQMLSHTPSLIAGVTEFFTNGTKFYEVVLLILSVFLYKQIKKTIPETAHILGECLESSGDYGKLMNTLKKLKDKTLVNSVKECVMSSAGKEH